ncbi:selenocysteine-specific translation elongation factor [Pseudohongiella acticola]|uniref:selenocysteine-specific translation elongation factor n=1 Tax=Pseudohongiella acticola TaxID=1524254 RepID=UPI0030EDBE73
MIIATAGHVDHGKTTLIKALTGKNTDQLAEEQRRGLTIDLGFAWRHDSEAGTLGFVDVPGHARFIRTMLAGLAGVDAALLVIAADAGPMPQTHEHLALLELLGIHRGIVVMSRTDRADAQQQTDCRAAIHALLQHSPLASSPMIAVDSISGLGMDDLLAAIRTLAANTPTRSSEGHPRFLIDRRFTVPGAGSVVTGTLLNGRLSVAQQTPMQLAPVNRSVRLRGIQIDGQAATGIISGQRAALNLTGELDNEHPQRGDWLLAAEPDHNNRPLISQRLDVHLRILPDKSIHRGTLQILTGATAVSGRLVWLAPAAGKEPAAGKAPAANKEPVAGLAQLLLDKPVHVMAGDAVIVREPAANITLGGGRVLDPQGRQRGRSRPEALARLSALSTVSSATVALAVELNHQQEIDLTVFAGRWNLTAPELDELLTQHSVVRLGQQGLSHAHYAAAQAIILQCVQQAHDEHPEQLGIHPQLLLRAAATELSRQTAKRLVDQLVSEHRLHRHGVVLALPDHQAVPPAQDEALYLRVREALANAGLRPPIVGELGALLGLERDAMLAFMHRLQGWGYVLPVAPNRFYLPKQLDDLAAVAQALCEEGTDGGFSAADYRDRSDIGRNLTIRVLEYLDRVGITVYRNERRYMRVGWRCTVADKNR